MPAARLFVYGSLKRGGLHHDQLKSAVFVASVETSPGYALVEQGPYLALISVAGGAGTVAGELFELDPALWPRLDDFEGDGYERREVALGRGGGTALAYFKKSR